MLVAACDIQISIFPDKLVTHLSNGFYKLCSCAHPRQASICNVFLLHKFCKWMRILVVFEVSSSFRNCPLRVYILILSCVFDRFLELSDLYFGKNCNEWCDYLDVWMYRAIRRREA